MFEDRMPCRILRPKRRAATPNLRKLYIEDLYNVCFLSNRMENIDDASSMGAVVNTYINFIGIFSGKKNTLKV